jgi:class 3 adenylate cyclase
MGWKTITYLWQWQLQSSAAELWPYVADTHRFNHASGLPAMEYSEIALEGGGSRRIARTSRLGITVEFEDFPFDWIREQEFSVLRLFSHGPIARTFAKVNLEPNDQGTLLNYYVEVTPADFLGLAGIPYQFGWEMRRNFGRVFRQIDKALQHQASPPYAATPRPLSQSAQARLAALSEQLLNLGHESHSIRSLVEFIKNESELALARMRPYPLADGWGAPRRAILELFLSAAKIGLLNMRWDLLCPLCRGSTVSAASLDAVYKGVHCSTCNIDFESDLAKNVELTFTPHPQIRLVEVGPYCMGGPMTTPHILVHQNLAVGEKRVIRVKLEPGGYRLRTQRPGIEQWLALNSEESAAGSLSVLIETGTLTAAVQGCTPAADGKVTLEIWNKAAEPQRIYLERAEWYTDAATAVQVTTLQHFRDLFSDEVLRAGEEIGIQGITILFSDLVGSTAMYNRWGDAASYALVREQFAFLQRIVRRYDGAIVKTIGDAIMGAFADPAQGVRTALAIQAEIEKFNALHPDEPLKIKLGLHHGPCIAVNLNGRLDYFGATVNLASRLEGQSQGGDVVISERLLQDPAVAQLLEAMPVQISRFATTIKGFDENFCLYRLKLEQVKEQDFFKA